MTALEERLSEFLHDQADGDLADPTSIATVQRIAKRRSAWTRAAVGLASLTAIVGLASFVPTGTEPSALVTAQDPADEETDTDEPADEETTSETDAGTESDDNQPPGTPDRASAAPPPTQRIVADGQGGFAAVAASTTEGRTTFVRSDDGIDWYQAGIWQHVEDTFVHEMHFVDGKFVAVLDDKRLPGATPGDLVNPQVAVSTDLTDWRFIELSLPNPEGASRFRVDDIAITGDDIMLSIMEYRDPAGGQLQELFERGMCGFSTTPTTSTVTMCSGELVDFEVGESLLHHFARRRVLVSEGGGAAQEQPLALEEPVALEVFASDGTLISQEVYVELEPTMAERISWPEERALPELWAIANNSDDQLLVLREPDGTLLTALESEGSVTELPEEIVAPSQFAPRSVVSGPAGWAMLVGPPRTGEIEIERDGWAVTGLPGFGSLTITSTDGLERHLYQPTRGTVPPYLQWSLFGGVRLFRPGTNELLVELTSEESRGAYAAFTDRSPALPDAATFDGQLVVDDWTLSGDPLRGPLFLTSPDGVVQTFADGFAFANGDITDGVEIDLPTGTASLSFFSYRTRPLQFFVDGEVIVEFPMRDIHAGLIEPAFAEGVLDAPPAIPGSTPSGTSSSLLYSPDGVNWQVVDQLATQSQFGEMQVALGDDEILVVRANWPEPQRYELPLANDE